MMIFAGFPPSKHEDETGVKSVDFRLKEITMARFKHDEIYRGHACPCEVFS
jgi:hypothetical protein